MACKSCASDNQTEFDSEINIHFHALSGSGKASVLAFPTLAVCLDCGFSGFTLPQKRIAGAWEKVCGVVFGSPRYRLVRGRTVRPPR
jgi:hypothetical protein